MLNIAIIDSMVERTIEITNFKSRPTVFSVEELVGRYFPENQELSKEDLLAIRQTAYEVYKRQK